MCLSESRLGRRQWLSAAIVLAIALGGCASSGVSRQGSNQIGVSVMERATAYWAHVKANDRVAAWPYEELSTDPRWTLQAYLKRGGIVFDQVEVRGVISEQGDEALVEVYQEYSVPLVRIKRQQATMQDKWKRIDGVWYHADDRGVMFGK